jgi:hypothetical protein
MAEVTSVNHYTCAERKRKNTTTRRENFYELQASRSVLKARCRYLSSTGSRKTQKADTYSESSLCTLPSPRYRVINGIAT